MQHVCARNEKRLCEKVPKIRWQMNKRNGQKSGQTNGVQLENAKRTRTALEWNVVHLSTVNVHPFGVFFFGFLYPQTVRNRFQIVFLRHNHINNRYFV